MIHFVSEIMRLKLTYHFSFGIFHFIYIGVVVGVAENIRHSLAAVYDMKFSVIAFFAHSDTDRRVADYVFKIYVVFFCSLFMTFFVVYV